MSKKIIYSDAAPNPIGPYNQAILAGDTLYISGQIGIDATSGDLIEENITQETRQVMENLKAILAAAEMTFDDVVKCSIFLSDMDDFAAVNQVYGDYFSEAPPARETIAVKTLPKQVNVEISAIAVR